MYEEVFNNHIPSLCDIVRCIVGCLGTERSVCILWCSAIRCCCGNIACKVGGVRGKTFLMIEFMAQYIDKSALVAEIERRIDLLKTNESGVFHTFASEMIIIEYENILSFLDTLEVKEIDLEKSVKGRIDYPLIGADFPNIYPNYKELKDYCDKNGIKDEDEVKIIIIKDE